MNTKLGLLMGTGIFLAACEPVVVQEDPNNGIIIPDEVVQVAGPNQDLTTARLLPEDNCYWYMHRGPVETTLLPLRSFDGRAICVAQST